MDDVNWIYEKAKDRAESYGIEGVNYNLTLGVIKNVIPAIASTNAIIAAASCLEAIKILSYCSKVLNNNFLYLGLEGLHSMVQNFEKNENCMVCNTRVNLILIENSIFLFKDFIEYLKIKFNLKDPALYQGNNLLFINPETTLGNSIRYRLEMKLRYFF
jgi:ubiquitin-activating enzyme E1 C